MRNWRSMESPDGGLPLGDLDELVNVQVAKNLGQMTGGPIDFKPGDLGRLAHANMLLQRIGAEAAPAADPAV